MTSYLVPVLRFHMQVKQGFDVTDLDVHLSGITMLITKQEKSISRLKKQATASIWSYSRSIYQLVAGFTYPSKYCLLYHATKYTANQKATNPLHILRYATGSISLTKNSQRCLRPPHFPAENRADNDRQNFSF